MMQLNLSQPRTKRSVVVDEADGFAAARAVHVHLLKQGVRHAFCGALALALHRTARDGVGPVCARDIDVLLGEEAFDIEHDVVVARGIPVLASGVRVNAQPALGAWQQLLASDAVEHVDVGSSDALPVLSLHAIIAMKLSAKSVRDDADIVALLSSGRVDVGACMDWLRERRFDIARFDRLLSRVR